MAIGNCNGFQGAFFVPVCHAALCPHDSMMTMFFFNVLNILLPYCLSVYTHTHICMNACMWV